MFNSSFQNCWALFIRLFSDVYNGLIQLVKSLPFYLTDAKTGTPFWVESSSISPWGCTSVG